MENRRVERVMYMKFNNKDKHASLLNATNKGIVVINKSFKEVLNDVINDNIKVDIDTTVVDNTQHIEVALLWQAQIHENYIKTRSELGW